MSSSSEQPASTNKLSAKVNPSANSGLQQPRQPADTDASSAQLQDTTEPAPQPETPSQTLRRPPVRPTVAAPPSPANPAPASASLSDNTAAEPDVESDSSRLQPISPPSEPMQYRAIGLVRGRYIASDEQFNRGILQAEDGTELNAVLLGQVMSLVKKHLDLDQDHLWVVYPRTREKQRSLHVQIVGVWEPEKLHKNQESETEPIDETEQSYALSEPLSDGYFSVRGEVIFQSEDNGFVVVKIQQAPRKSTDKPKAFKLRLEGTLDFKAPGYFWNIDARRQENALIIEQGTSVALIPPKKRPVRKPGDRQRLQKRVSPRPSRPLENKFAASPPPRREPAAKPIKRQNHPATGD